MNKTVLLLGGLGFIGQNLIEELKAEYQLIVFGHSAAASTADYIYYQGDFRNQAAVEVIFQKHTIDLVIHAISGTIPSNEDSLLDIDVNLKSTIQLLELLKKYTVPKIIFLSSGGTVYGLINETGRVAEDHPTNPISAYGINKLAIEKYLYLYHHLYQIDYLILRLSNPFGEHHTSQTHGLINVTLKKILNHEPVLVWGDGAIIRDYIYIQDCVNIIHQLITKNVSNEIINIGSSEGYSINNMLSIIQEQIGDFTIVNKPARPCDVPKIILDTTKLQSFVTVQLTPLAAAIQQTYQWLKQ